MVGVQREKSLVKTLNLCIYRNAGNIGRIFAIFAGKREEDEERNKLFYQGGWYMVNGVWKSGANLHIKSIYH